LGVRFAPRDFSAAAPNFQYPAQRNQGADAATGIARRRAEREHSPAKDEPTRVEPARMSEL